MKYLRTKAQYALYVAFAIVLATGTTEARSSGSGYESLLTLLFGMPPLVLTAYIFWQGRAPRQEKSTSAMRQLVTDVSQTLGRLLTISVVLAMGGLLTVGIGPLPRSLGFLHQLNGQRSIRLVYLKASLIFLMFVLLELAKSLNRYWLQSSEGRAREDGPT